MYIVTDIIFNEINRDWGIVNVDTSLEIKGTFYFTLNVDAVKIQHFSKRAGNFFIREIKIKVQDIDNKKIYLIDIHTLFDYVEKGKVFGSKIIKSKEDDIIGQQISVLILTYPAYILGKYMEFDCYEAELSKERQYLDDLVNLISICDVNNLIAYYDSLMVSYTKFSNFIPEIILQSLKKPVYKRIKIEDGIISIPSFDIDASSHTVFFAGVYKYKVLDESFVKKFIAKQTLMG